MVEDSIGFSKAEVDKWQKDVAAVRRQLFGKKREDDSWKSEERRRPLRGGSLGIRTG